MDCWSVCTNNEDLDYWRPSPTCLCCPSCVVPILICFVVTCLVDVIHFKGTTLRGQIPNMGQRTWVLHKLQPNSMFSAWVSVGWLCPLWLANVCHNFEFRVLHVMPPIKNYITLVYLMYPSLGEETKWFRLQMSTRWMSDNKISADFYSCSDWLSLTGQLCIVVTASTCA